VDVPENATRGSIGDEGSGAPIEMPEKKCFKGARDCHPLLFSGLWLAESA
jgi:hypothetical protein